MLGAFLLLLVPAASVVCGFTQVGRFAVVVRTLAWLCVGLFAWMTAVGLLTITTYQSWRWRCSLFLGHLAWLRL